MLKNKEYSGNALIERLNWLNLNYWDRNIREPILFIFHLAIQQEAYLRGPVLVKQGELDGQLHRWIILRYRHDEIVRYIVAFVQRAFAICQRLACIRVRIWINYRDPHDCDSHASCQFFCISDCKRYYIKN